MERARARLGAVAGHLAAATPVVDPLWERRSGKHFEDVHGDIVWCAPSQVHRGAAPLPPSYDQSLAATREELAEAYRLCDTLGLNGGRLDNHLTVSVGPDYDRFLLNRFGLHYSEVTAANLLLVDRHGEVLEGEGPLMNAAFVIHSVIHSRLGAQARVVLHTHQPWATSLCCTLDSDKDILSRSPHPAAAALAAKTAVDPVFALARPPGTLGQENEDGAALAALFTAGKTVLLMGGHGVTVIGDSVAEAMAELILLEAVARALILDGAAQAGIALPAASSDKAQRLWRHAEGTMGPEEYRAMLAETREPEDVATLWDGLSLRFPGPAGFTLADAELRREQVDAAAAMRLLAEAGFTGRHLSVVLGDGCEVVAAPADIDWASARAGEMEHHAFTASDRSGQVRAHLSPYLSLHARDGARGWGRSWWPSDGGGSEEDMVGCVMAAEAPWISALMAVGTEQGGGELLPVSQTVLRFFGHVGRDETGDEAGLVAGMGSGSVVLRREGERLIAAAWGPSIAHALYALFLLEQAAELQLMACASVAGERSRLRFIDNEVVQSNTGYLDARFFCPAPNAQCFLEAAKRALEGRGDAEYAH